MKRTDRFRSVTLVVLGVVIGVMLLAPASAHFRPKVGHLFKHLKEKFDAIYLNVDEQLPAARVFRTSVQSIPNNALTTVVFDAEAFDLGGLYDPRNPSRLEATRSGIYQVSGTANFFVNPNGGRVYQIWRNGTERLVSDSTDGSSDQDSVVTTLVRLAAGDFVELRVSQDSGGSLNLACCPPGTTPVLAMHWVGPA